MSWNFVSPNNFISMSDMNFFAHFESGLRGIQSKTFEMVPDIIEGTCQCVIFLVVNLTGVEHITGLSARRRQPRTRTCSLKGSSNFCVNLEWERKNINNPMLFLNHRNHIRLKIRPGSENTFMIYELWNQGSEIRFWDWETARFVVLD